MGLTASGASQCASGTCASFGGFAPRPRPRPLPPLAPRPPLPRPPRPPTSTAASSGISESGDGVVSSATGSIGFVAVSGPLRCRRGLITVGGRSSVCVEPAGAASDGDLPGEDAACILARLCAVDAMCATAASILSPCAAIPASTFAASSAPNSKSVDASGDGVRVVSSASGSFSTPAAALGDDAFNPVVTALLPAVGLVFLSLDWSIHRRPLSAVSRAPWSPPSSVFMSKEVLCPSAVGGGGSRPASVRPRPAGFFEAGCSRAAPVSTFSTSSIFSTASMLSTGPNTAPRDLACSAAFAVRYTLTPS